MLNVVGVFCDLFWIAFAELSFEELNSVFDFDSCTLEEGTILKSSIVSHMMLVDQLFVHLAQNRLLLACTMENDVQP